MSELSWQKIIEILRKQENVAAEDWPKYACYGLKCDKCGKEFVIRATIHQDSMNNKNINCPSCNEFVKTIKADTGYEILK